MKLRYDPVADAVSVDVRGPILPGETDAHERLDEDRSVRYGADGHPVGYQFLNARRYGVRLNDLQHRDELRALLREFDFVERDWGSPVSTRRIAEPPPKTKAIIERWRQARRDAASRA